ncbi:hypothetical protein B0H16DRAFT_1750345 [Mycena metata]|uniref:F-box domain-containing protein n=1 Tax=Mycena metata TaxID=1033252 RepID=A0AAD7DP41_9AGAR|nr:hypothetical protein B0H16DRAFT_1750345 [Mycena metata]
MARSRLTLIPPELKLLIYSECHPHDLLSISHVSKFWRYLALSDKRWDEWFGLISHKSQGTAAAFLSRYKVLGLIPTRTIVTLCFYNKCFECSEYTTDIFLPLLKRICVKCRRDKKYAVISLSSALTTYALAQKDLDGIMILHWEETDPAVKHRLGLFYRAKLLSEATVKEIAIRKHGSEANLKIQLERKKAVARTAYDKRVADYDVAKREADAKAVAAGKDKPKSRRPALPPILKTSLTPEFYQHFALFRFGFLSVNAGGLALRQLVRCRICVIMENIRESEWKVIAPDVPYDWKDPGIMPPELIPNHEEEMHYNVNRPQCRSHCEEDPENRCGICLHEDAIWLANEFSDSDHECECE